MSEIAVILEQVREHYISAYIEVAEDYKKKFDQSSPEVLLEIGGNENKPYPYRLYRMDLMSGSVEPPNMTDFNNDSHLVFEPIVFTADGRLKVTLSSFSWNAVEFEGSCFPPDNEQIITWALKWLDVEEVKQLDENNFGGYIHSITYPEIDDNKCNFSVDFGTAPIDSFYELLHILMNLEVKELSIHSNSYHQ